MADKLSRSQIEEWIAAHSRWKFRDNAIRKHYMFPSFRSAIVFVNRVATIADEEGHHPDIQIRYDRVSLHLWSHDAGGVTERDLKLAERIDFATSAR
ncbi:MAG: 4a-hydroxytetrahydrobiopterin dehydratase [Deltaproteobacteria bacterium]|nr:4a-hydroxytetrahydrobiopterin dehydratase [Deltaproteobacteria bacterium]MDE0035913.1 4a-hydroxytetrahydrobiopterin dehydratase [Deltaproteobacteria bacterium]